MEKKIRKEAEKALIRIPEEINRLARVIALLGEALCNHKAKKLKQEREEFKELLKEKQGEEQKCS